MRIRTMIGVGLAAVFVAATSATAQGAPQILFSSPGPWASNPIGTALARLDLDSEIASSPADLLAALRRQEWDLVIIRWYPPYPPEVYFEILGELTAHVDRGGGLMFSIAELDRMPEYWPLLGITGATDLQLPLSDIIPPEGFIPVERRHPAFRNGFLQVGDELFGPDYGDSLVPSQGSIVLASFADSADPAIVLAHNGRVIVNGQEWDNWGSISVAGDQIQWLLGCPADLDGDGELTVFDFVEFQNRFDSGGGAGFADFSYDGRLDVFDFLEFFNLFEAGCR